MALQPVGRFNGISTLVSDIAGSADRQVRVAVTQMDGVTQRGAAMVEWATAALRLTSDRDEIARHLARLRVAGARGDARPSRPARPLPRLQAHGADATLRSARPAPATHGDAARAPDDDRCSAS